MIKINYAEDVNAKPGEESEVSGKEFFEKSLTDENFIPNPEKGDKSFFEKVKDMFS